jgi:predicted phosphoribosyltransferase
MNSMYFTDRAEAGQKLAQLLVPKYRGRSCAIVALSDGGVIVGSHLAVELQCALMMLLSEEVDVPGENVAVGSIDQGGSFTYNTGLSSGQLQEYTDEYHGYIEQQKLEKLHTMNRLLSSGGIIEPGLLRDRIVILVSDGINSPMPLDVAATYLKPYRLEKLIVATPVASVPAVDRMHIVADELYCLSTIDNYIDTNHYYENNNLPTHDEIIALIQNIMFKV